MIIEGISQDFLVLGLATCTRGNNCFCTKDKKVNKDEHSWPKGPTARLRHPWYKVHDLSWVSKCFLPRFHPPHVHVSSFPIFLANKPRLCIPFHFSFNTMSPKSHLSNPFSQTILTTLRNICSFVLLPRRRAPMTCQWWMRSGWAAWSLTESSKYGRFKSAPNLPWGPRENPAKTWRSISPLGLSSAPCAQPCPLTHHRWGEGTPYKKKEGEVQHCKKNK